MKKIISFLAFCLVCLAFASNAFAESTFEYKGSIYTDLRFSVPGQDKPDYVEDWRFLRSDNTAKITAKWSWNDVSAIIDLGLTYSGKSDAYSYETLQRRSAVDPFYFESDALYIQINNFIAEGLDVKIGRQIVSWGTADRFNPTSVINSLDLEDPQDFGKRIANEMINVTYTPDIYIEGENMTIFSDLTFQVVWVPLFRSALLPESGEYTYSEPKQFRRFVNSPTIHKLIDIQELFVKYGGKVVYDVHESAPDDAIKNSQVGGRISFTLLGVDIGLSGYYGFDHNVQPSQAIVNAVSTRDDVNSILPVILPQVANGTAEQLAGVKQILTTFGEEGKVKTLTGYTDVTLVYPHIWSLGLDFATSLNFLWGTGLWGEVTVTFHDDVLFDLDINGTKVHEKQVKGGHFWKAVVGIDNSPCKWFYFNLQYVYGFVDEFGADDLGHYLVANFDFKAVNEQMLIRISSVINFDGAETSAMLVPMLSFKFWPNTELIAGAMVHIGNDDSIFGNRYTGQNYIYLQGRYSF